MLGSHTHQVGRPGYAPERRHLIIAKARANVLRRVHTIGNQTGRWPVAIAIDTVRMTSPEPDPEKRPATSGSVASRAAELQGSLPLQEHLEYLQGGSTPGAMSSSTTSTPP